MPDVTRDPFYGIIMQINSAAQKPMSFQTCGNDFAPEIFYTEVWERRILEHNDKDG